MEDGKGCVSLIGVVVILIAIGFSCYFIYQETEASSTIEKAIVTDKVYDDEFEHFYMVVKHRDKFHIFTVKKSVFDKYEPKSEIEVEQPISKSGRRKTPRLISGDLRYESQ